MHLAPVAHSGLRTIGICVVKSNHPAPIRFAERAGAPQARDKRF